MATSLYMSDFAAGSQLLRTMPARAQNRFQQIIGQLKEDTGFELTETEYFNMAKRLYFCEQIEVQIELDGAAAVNKDVLILYNQVQESIMNTMRKFREGRINTKNSIEGLKRAVVEMVGPDGTLKIEYTKGTVIDATVREVAAPEDSGMRGEVVDAPAVRNKKGHHTAVDDTPSDLP